MGTGVNDLIVNATDNNDNVSFGGLNLNVNNQLFTILNEQTVTLNLGDGDDVANVVPIVGTTISVNGGDPSASDVLNFAGVGGTGATLDLAAQTITLAGFSPVSFSGIEVLNVNVGGDISVQGTNGPDDISVTPTGASTATITAAGLNTTINTTNGGTLSVDALGGADTITVNGRAGIDDTIAVSGTSVAIRARDHWRHGGSPHRQR